jgi:hypothetical protein
MDPYIGITDFMNRRQVEAILKVFNAHLAKESNRKLGVGVMMFRRMLYGLESKWAGITPRNDEIAGIFSFDVSDGVYNCLHYADYSRVDFELWKALYKGVNCGGIGIHALQLDMVWPAPEEIFKAVHASRKQIEVILQIGKKSFEEVGNNPRHLVDKLADYEQVIHRVLLDRSMGRGIGLEADFLLPFARAIRKNFPGLGLVFAGGLGPETMHLVRPLLEEFPEASFDAEAQLHMHGDILDSMDWIRAEEYLIESLGLFS